MHGHGVSAINHPCTICSQPTSMWCSRCQNAWYCSPEHIHDDWPRHRKECTPAIPNIRELSSNVTINATLPPVEPELITFSAIYFAPFEVRPRTVSVHCRPARMGPLKMCPTPILEGFFEDRVMESIVLTQGLNGDSLRFPLQLWYSPTQLDKPGIPPNRAIFHVTSGAAEKLWTGPVVVLKHNGSRLQGYTDASLNDLPALSAYFLSYK